MDALHYDSKRLLTALASLGEIAFHAPSIFEAKHKHIIREFLVKELLLVDRVCTILLKMWYFGIFCDILNVNRPFRLDVTILIAKGNDGGGGENNRRQLWLL